ncbi:hypothetical protein HYT55_04650 [Candidatus Woesearchaeota archaeon]|nr:hypothetical protein [Candidatus Woesearchaeota archaeon]
MNREFTYLGQGVYTRQREFSAEELRVSQSKTVTEVAMFDRFFLPTVEGIFSSIRRTAVLVQTSPVVDESSVHSNLESVLRTLDPLEIDRLAKGELKLYQTLKGLVPSLPSGQGYTRFVRGQTGYLPGVRDILRGNPSYISALRDPVGVRSSMLHPQNRALGFGISGRVEVGVTDSWTILDPDVLGTLIRESVRQSNTLSVFGRVDRKLLTDLYYQVIDLEFVGNLTWLPHSSEDICESLAIQTFSVYLQQLAQQREAETILGARISELSEMISCFGVPRNPLNDRPAFN